MFYLVFLLLNCLPFSRPTFSFLSFIFVYKTINEPFKGTLCVSVTVIVTNKTEQIYKEILRENVVNGKDLKNISKELFGQTDNKYLYRKYINKLLKEKKEKFLGLYWIACIFPSSKVTLKTINMLKTCID